MRIPQLFETSVARIVSFKPILQTKNLGLSIWSDVMLEWRGVSWLLLGKSPLIQMILNTGP